VSCKKTNAQANTPRTLEFRLLLDCLRGPEGALPVELIQSDLNWNLFLQTAQRHAVRPLVYRALANHPSVLGPAREVLESDFRQNALRSVALAAEPKWAEVTGRDLYLRAANAENNKATTRRHESAKSIPACFYFPSASISTQVCLSLVFEKVSALALLVPGSYG